ncbi:PH domain-containing protein [Formosa sp. S-31]|uniref:PH domain-containing protein n=1 Tax=Formosa sp. S-31 TaxID=2790949 RepID=UPI003EB75955
MKKYKASTRGYIKYVLLVLLILPILIFCLDRPAFSEKPAIILPLIIPVVFVIWIFMDTYYKIEKDAFFYRSGLLRGRIDISSIKAIENNNTLWVGIKPALATHGMVIKYNIYD